MDILNLLQRTDLYEIIGNKMTSYCSTLGGGSINYWDGKIASFHIDNAICDLTAFIEVHDISCRINLLQEMFHFWRPDKITNKFISHKRTCILEEKTIHDDIFVSKIDLYNDNDVNLILSIKGKINENSSVIFFNNAIIIQKKQKANSYGGDNAQESKIYKVFGFNKESSCDIHNGFYTLELPVRISGSLKENKDNHYNITFAIAASDNKNEAVDKFYKALKDPDILFHERNKIWTDYFNNNVPAFFCDNPKITKMYYHIFYMIKSNIYSFSKGFFKYNFESTGKFRLFPQWFWDSAFGAINEKWLNNSELPRSSMMNILEAQRSDGLLPFSLCIDQYTYGKWEVIQPFVIPIAIWDYYLKSNDKDFLTRALPVLAKFDKWMMENRDKKNEDLINIKEASGESGWDNSKRYVLGEHLIQNESPIFKQKKFIQSPDFNTYLYISRKIILKIAREIGKEREYKGFQSKMERTKLGIQGMWNNDIGLYMDRFEKDHKQIPVRTPGGIIPLLCGFTEPERIKKIIRNLKDPDIFWTPFPIVTLDMKDPAYSNKDDYFSYWNGRVWPHINWLVIEGLYRSKEHITALDLSKLTIRMCYATGEPLCMENYNPDTGYPYLSHNCFNYIWGGMFLDILMRRIAGFQGNAPKNEVYINPLLNEDITQLSIEGIKIGEHIIDFSLKSTTEKEVALVFSHRGAVPIDLITSSGREKVYNTELKRKITFFNAPHFLDL